MECRVCREDKTESDFYKGHKTCKSCRIKKIKEWKKKNPEKVKASARKTRALRGEEIRKRQQEWRNSNRERYRENCAKYRDNNREKIRERSRKYYHENKEKYRIYAQKNKDKCREYSANYRKRHLHEVRKRRRELARKYRKEKPVEHKARKIVYYAVKKGDLTRSEKCLLCGKKCKTEAHHHDYKKPLEVTWLCRLCHAGVHSMVIK